MTLFEELNQKYHGLKTQGKAFFWNDSLPGDPSLHFDVSDLQWTFSHGSDHQESYVEGTLFYNEGYFDGEKLPKDQLTEAGFFVDQEREDGVLYVLISFYAPDSGNELIGEFLARDPKNAAASSELLRKQGLEGVWEFHSGESLYERLYRKYDGRNTNGEASFRSNPDAPASLLFDVTDLSWKFSHNNPSGQAGLRGTLFYNDGFFDGDDASLPRDQPTRAGFFVDQASEDGKLYVLIKFYAPDSEDELLGEFLALDPNNAAGSSGLLHEQQEGDWEYVNLPYPHHTPAVAFFFKESSGTPFLHLVANQLGWEFSDGYVGAGTQGTFSYRAGYFDGPNPRLDPNNPTKADFYVDQYRENNELMVHIKFYAPGSQHELLGEFTAKDPFNRSGESGILDQRKTATWGRAEHFSGVSTGSKNSNNTRILITAAFFRKWAEMDCTPNDKIYGEAFNVQGRITFKGSPPAYGRYVRWYRDCAVFVDSANARNYTAFFLRTNETDTLGSTDGLGWDVEWTNV